MKGNEVFLTGNQTGFTSFSVLAHGKHHKEGHVFGVKGVPTAFSWRMSREAQLTVLFWGSPSGSVISVSCYLVFLQGHHLNINVRHRK